METVTRKNFYSFIDDIINYLSLYIDTTEIEKNFKNTKYILTNAEKNKIRIYKGEYLDINVQKDAGITVVPVLADNSGFKLINPICYVRNMPFDPEGVKTTMFHELMHVASHKQELLSRYKLLYKTGLYSKIYDANTENLDGPEKYEYLNECMTELVSKIIYDKLYNKNYEIVSFDGKEYKASIYERGYFLLAFLLLNYFEKHLDVLFEIYFNNNVKLFQRVLKREFGITLDTLNKKLVEFNEKREDIYVDMEYRKIIKDLNKQNPINNKNVLYQYQL